MHRVTTTAHNGAETTHERRRDASGGVSWLSTLVGWLAAAGLTAILAGILTAGGAALAVGDVAGRIDDGGIDDGDAETVGLAGGIAGERFHRKVDRVI